jgi:hypothetical protein
MKKARARCAGQGCGSAKHQNLITLTAPAAQSPLQIERVVTLDGLDGQPWPPTGLNDGWHLIRSSGGETTWRRITLAVSS